MDPNVVNKSHWDDVRKIRPVSYGREGFRVRSRDRAPCVGGFACYLSQTQVDKHDFFLVKADQMYVFYLIRVPAVTDKRTSLV